MGSCFSSSQETKTKKPKPIKPKTKEVSKPVKSSGGIIVMPPSGGGCFAGGCGGGGGGKCGGC